MKPNPPRPAARKAKLPHYSYQVLTFEPLLTHSVWTDWFCDGHPTESEVLEMLRAGVESGEYVGWRVITIHKEVTGRDDVSIRRLNHSAEVKKCPACIKAREKWNAREDRMARRGNFGIVPLPLTCKAHRPTQSPRP